MYGISLLAAALEDREAKRCDAVGRTVLLDCMHRGSFAVGPIRGRVQE
jgi:hypothetical protein